MPPDFADVEYWNARFTTEAQFEWLKKPAELTSHLTDILQKIPDLDQNVLHIGSGSSTLSLTLRSLVSHPEKIHNVDYSPKAIELGMAMEQNLADSVDDDGDSSPHMRWSCIDLLSRHDVLSVLHDNLFHPLYTLIVDKSVADSIACGANVMLDHRAFIPSTKQHLWLDENSHQIPLDPDCSVHPIILLALHLATVTPPDAYWLCVSFSSDRFLFLTDQTMLEKVPPPLRPTVFWTLDSVEPLSANDLTEDVTHRDHPVYNPTIDYWLYRVKRTDQSMALAEIITGPEETK